MPRGVSGTYTLPAGNPVVTGTEIETTWGNDTMNDLATALTGSLSRSGDGGMLAALKLIDGTSGAPGMTWATQTTAGWYRAGASDFRFVLAGVDRIKVTTAGVSVYDGSALQQLGYLRLPVRVVTGTDSTLATDSGKLLQYTGAVGTLTLASGTLIATDTVTGINTGTGVLTIAETLSGTLIWLDGSGVLSKTGSRSVAIGGVFTIYMIDANNAYIWGNAGIS